MATFNKIESFAGSLAFGDHHLDAGGDTFKIYLSNTAPSASADDVKADCAEIAAGNGYTSGGEDTQNDCTEASGTATMTCVDVVWTASGGAIAQFRYVLMYNDTSGTDLLVCWWDYGSAVDLAEGETFTADFGASTLTIA